MLKYNFMQGYTYILQCSDGSYYVGSTQDQRRRIWQHNSGAGANYTAKRLPVKLVYFERYSRIDTAFKRKKQLHGWGRRKKEALIVETLSCCMNLLLVRIVPIIKLRLVPKPDASASLSDRPPAP